MFKTQYPTNHLKKEGVNSKVAELSDEMQYTEQVKEFSQFERYRRSDVDSESESRFKRIDVPGDGSCLFWSVTMAYLIPVRNDDALFRQRYKALFGNGEDVTKNLDRIRGLVRNLSTADYDDAFVNLVRNVFRNRVVDYIRDHENEFRDFVEGNFENYLENMRNPNTWGGEPEIRAMSGMLSATISVSGEVETQYGDGDIQIQLFHVGAPGKRNHYNFGLERGIVDNDAELAKGLKKVMGKGRPQDFELIQLLIEEAGKEVGTSQQGEDFKSFETRFQSFIDQIPSYLHSVEKAGFFTHFFLGSFSTLLDTEIAEKLNIKKIYFSFDTSKTLKVAIVKNGQIGNAEDAINNIDLFSISEGKRVHQFTVNELESILRNNIDRSKIRDRNVEQNIKNEIQDRIKSRLVQIYKGKDGIFVNMEVKEILDSSASKEFHEIEKGVWNNPEADIAELSSSREIGVKESLEGILRKISKVHSKYENSLIYDKSAREAAHHGFMVGVFMNFHYRYNLRVYPEQFAGRGYADIILLARGPDRALDSIPIIIELKAGAGTNATPDKALQQAEKYAQGFQPNVQRVLTTADNILCVGVNLDNPSPISDIKVSNRREIIIPLFQDMLKSSDDWDTQEIYTNALKKRIKNNIERIYHTFPGTSEKGDNHYFSRFLLGQSLLLNRVEDLKTGFKKYIFIYGDNIPTEVHPNLRRLGRPAAERARERLLANLDASHAVVTMVLIPENIEKLVYVINIIEANRKDVLNMLNEVLPLDRLNREIGNREIVELNLNFDTRYKSDFRRYLTIWTEKYNYLQEYNNGAERFQGTFREVPYPNRLKETFDQALDAQSLSIDEYNKLLEKIGEGIFPFKSLVNKEAHFQGILNGVFSYYSDLKLQESPETRALVLTEFQTGRGERIDMLVHGIKFVAQGGNAEEYTPIGLELKTSRQGKGAQALLREANDQINEEYKEGVTYKTLTDGDEVKFIGVVFDKGSNNPNKLILTSRTTKEGFIPVGVVHSSVHMLPTVGQCSKGEKREPSLPEYPPSKKPRRERSVSMACIDSFDEEKITEEEKEQRIKELFNADKVAERVKNIEFYDQLFKVSQQTSKGEIIDKNVEEAFVAKIKDIDLDSIDPEIRDIVKEMKDNIENKEEVKNILRRSGVAEKIGKVAEGAGLAFTAFLVGKHIANGDIEGLGYDALNLWVMPKIGEKISGKILELGTKLDSQMLKEFAPAMGRAIGNFAAFLGLAESIKARQSATDPTDIKIADLNIATNSIFIAADVPAVVTETMSAIGMEAGIIGEFAGPVGAAISVAVIIVSQFVEAGLEVEKLTEQMSLTDQEKHDFYWDFFLGKKLPDYIGNDLQAKEMYKQYISKVLDNFDKDNYTQVVMSLPSILIKKEEYATNSYSRSKRHWEGIGIGMLKARSLCNRVMRIISTEFDFEQEVRATYPFYNIEIARNFNRVVPSTIGSYNLVCGPQGDDVAKQIVSTQELAKLPVNCDPYDNKSKGNQGAILKKIVERWFLQEHMTDCYNAVSYNRNNPSGPVKMLFYMSNNNAFINVTSNYTIDVIFNGKNILLNSYGINNQGSGIQNRYYFTNQLSNCDIHKQGTNFFYIAKDNFVCNLGGSSIGQNNIVVTRSNFTDSENIHSIIGSDKANYIEVSHASYVDGKGGNDVITAKNFTTIKGYFGDSIHGKGLVLLPINFSDIGSMTHANNIINIYNKSGAFISVDKQTSVKTTDGLFVTPTKVDINTDRVTNVHITKLDNELDNLQKMDNSSFNVTKQLLNTNYHGVTGSFGNHIFYPDEEHHDFYWKAPSNISHLYLFDNRNANIMISQANGILDFSLLNSTLNDMPFIEDNKGEIKINKNGLNVTLLPNYKDVTVTFDGEEYYKLQNGELERDYCSHSLKIDRRFSVNGTGLLSHHNCFLFGSDKVLFLKLKNDLLLLSDRGALSISDYYSSVHKNWDLSVQLNNRIIEPEEFGERADEFSSFRYYQPDEQGLQIYHNQPINKNDIGLVDLKDKSILDFDMKVMNDTLLLLHKNNTLVKIENWNTYQSAREMMFAFNDAIASNSKCIVSTCDSEDVIVEFNKEKLVLSTEQLFDAVKQNNLNKVKELINQGANINATDMYGKTPLGLATQKGYEDIVRILKQTQLDLDKELLINVQDGDLNKVKDLIARGASLEAKDDNGSTPLNYAAWNGQSGVVVYLVENGANLETKNHYGRTALHDASLNNHLDIVEYLVKKGIGINATDENGWTSLHWATSKGCFEVAKFLIEKGASINAQAKDLYGKKPIHVAAENNNKNIIELLLSKGVSVDEAERVGNTPLHYTAWKGCLEAAKFLVDNGANVNVADTSTHGKKPIHVAAENNNKNIIEFLLNKGVNVGEADKNGSTPLHYAAKFGQLEVAKFLIEKGEDINAKDKDEKTPLDLAIQGNYTDIVGFLKQTQLDKKLLTAIENGDLPEVRKFVSQGASVNAIEVGIFGRKPIHIAAEKNYKDIIEFLLGKGVSVDDTSNYGWTPLHYTASKGCLEVAKFLVDKGANINAQNVYGREPIHIAAERDNKNIIELLLNKGVSINEFDKDSWMPLHWASWNGHLDITEYLVGKGANINAKDRNGKTPLDIARDKGYNNVAEYLQQTQLGLDRQLLTAVQGVNLNEVKDFVVRGASLDTQDNNNGWTPIVYAAWGSKWDMVKFLIAQGAKFNNEITYQGTPLHFAAQEGNSNMVQFLLDKGANIEAQDAYNRKPLHIAVDANRLNVVNLLLGRGANLKATDMYGKTSLDLVIQKGYEDIVEVLKQKQLNLDKELLIASEKGDIEKVRDSIRQGANVNVQGRQGWTPVFWTIQKNNFNIIELLLDNNADIKVKDNEGWTPLHWAVSLGSLDIVEHLVERGADVNASTADGRTPLDIARDKGYNNIVNYLEEELNKEREKPAQRKRRHHHGDHDRHHSSRKPFAIDLSNQPEIAASSGARPSSWINSWVKGKGSLLVSGVVNSVWPASVAKLSKETSYGFTTKNNLEPIDYSQIDMHGTILLLDTFIKKITGQKYISTADKPISPLEAQGYTFDVMEGFKKAVEQAASKSGISMHRLNIDFMEIRKEITGKIMSDKFNEIPGTLNSYVEKACPGKETGCPGKLSLKKFNKFITEFNKGLDVTLMQQILNNRDSTLEVNDVKEQQISLEPKSYLSDTFVQCHLTQNRGLRNQGRALIP